MPTLTPPKPPQLIGIYGSPISRVWVIQHDVPLVDPFAADTEEVNIGYHASSRERSIEVRNGVPAFFGARGCQETNEKLADKVDASQGLGCDRFVADVDNHRRESNQQHELADLS